MGIIIQDREYCDAEIIVTEVNHPFMENEWGELIAIVPFCNSMDLSESEFRAVVFAAFDALAVAYENWPQCVNMQVKFHNKYIGA